MLEEAIKALDTLKPADITEVKGMKSPPKPVKLVMEAVCIMKGLKPARAKMEDGSMGSDYWETSKKMLSDYNFLKSLKEYDKDNIDPTIISKMKVRRVTCVFVWCCARLRFPEHQGHCPPHLSTLRRRTARVVRCTTTIQRSIPS